MNLDNAETIDRFPYVMLEAKQLQEGLVATLDQPLNKCSEHAEVAFRMCVVTIEQAAALRTLVVAGMVTSAACMLRAQSEALTKAAWLAYAEDDNSDAVIRLFARLKEGGEKLERALPTAEEMIDQIGENLSDEFAHLMHSDLVRLNQVSWHMSNSFVFGGLNQRILDQDVPEERLATQLIEHSNNLLLVTSEILAKLQSESTLSAT